MFLWFPVLDLARAPRRTARKKGSGYENERLADFSIFNMADMYKCILEELEKVSTKSWAEFKNCCTEIMERIGVFRWKVPHYSKFTVDFNSQQYLPSSSDCVALETSADSSC
jgi:hypothetical protein